MDQAFVTSREVYERESERIFAHAWLCVAHADQLEPDGGPLPCQAENHQLILVRDAAGEIHAFRNVCRHRGSVLVTEENCQRMGQCIQCPYHAWTYDRQGQLRSAPNMEGVAGFVKEEYGLIDVPCGEYGGFVWVSLQPQEPLETYLTPLASVFTDWSTDELQLAAKLHYNVQANWKLIFQNYSECYHCPGVHPALNRLTPYQGAANVLHDGAILGGPMGLGDGCDTMSTSGRWVGRCLPRLNADQSRSVYYFTVFPSIFFSAHPDYVLVHQVQRVDVRRSAVTCWFLFHSETVREVDFDPQPAVAFWDQTNREDWRVCELTQAGMEDPGYVPGPYSELESVVAAFDRHYRQQLNG